MNHQSLRYETTRCAPELFDVFEDLPEAGASGA
jgi:hypothetical protein